MHTFLFQLFLAGVSKFLKKQQAENILNLEVIQLLQLFNYEIGRIATCKLPKITGKLAVAFS